MCLGDVLEREAAIDDRLQDAGVVEVFDDGPTPSSMVLLRPLSADDKDWTEESIVAPRESREFGLGKHHSSIGLGTLHDEIERAVIAR